jgi:hypothetical protein
MSDLRTAACGLLVNKLVNDNSLCSKRTVLPYSTSKSWLLYKEANNLIMPQPLHALHCICSPVRSRTQLKLLVIRIRMIG